MTRQVIFNEAGSITHTTNERSGELRLHLHAFYSPAESHNYMQLQAHEAMHTLFTERTKKCAVGGRKWNSLRSGQLRKSMLGNVCM